MFSSKNDQARRSRFIEELWKFLELTDGERKTPDPESHVVPLLNH